MREGALLRQRQAPSCALVSRAGRVQVADLLIDYLPAEARGIRDLVDLWRVDLRNDGAQRALDRHLAGLLRGLRRAERVALERRAQINAYAVPAVGQGVVIVGGGDKHPHAARKWKFRARYPLSPRTDNGSVTPLGL